MKKARRGILDLSMSRQGQIYFPKKAREVLGKIEERQVIEVGGIANATTVVLFPKDTDLDHIKESLSVIINDINLRIKIEKKEELLPIPDTSIKIEEKDDKFVFIKGDRRISVPKKNIRDLLKKLSVDEVSQMLYDGLLKTDIDVELSEMKKIVAKV